MLVRELVAGRLVDAVVEGDLAGPARLEVDAAENGPGSVARLTWAVELRRPVLRAVAQVARPTMEWGHDWVVTQGVEQFRRTGIGVEDPTMTIAPERPDPTDPVPADRPARPPAHSRTGLSRPSSRSRAPTRCPTGRPCRTRSGAVPADLSCLQIALGDFKCPD